MKKKKIKCYAISVKWLVNVKNIKFHYINLLFVTDRDHYGKTKAI